MPTLRKRSQPEVSDAIILQQSKKRKVSSPLNTLKNSKKTRSGAQCNLTKSSTLHSSTNNSAEITTPMLTSVPLPKLNNKLPHSKSSEKPISNVRTRFRHSIEHTSNLPNVIEDSKKMTKVRAKVESISEKDSKDHSRSGDLNTSNSPQLHLPIQKLPNRRKHTKTKKVAVQARNTYDFESDSSDNEKPNQSMLSPGKLRVESKLQTKNSSRVQHNRVKVCPAYAFFNPTTAARTHTKSPKGIVNKQSAQYVQSSSKNEVIEVCSPPLTNAYLSTHRLSNQNASRDLTSSANESARSSIVAGVRHHPLTDSSVELSPSKIPAYIASTPMPDFSCNQQNGRLFERPIALKQTKLTQFSRRSACSNGVLSPNQIVPGTTGNKSRETQLRELEAMADAELEKISCSTPAHVQGTTTLHRKGFNLFHDDLELPDSKASTALISPRKVSHSPLDRQCTSHASQSTNSSHRNRSSSNDSEDMNSWLVEINAELDKMEKSQLTIASDKEDA